MSDEPVPKSIWQMTREEREAVMKANPPTVELINGGAYFNWFWKGCGFGQLSFNFDPETQKLTAMVEMMGKESVRTLLYALADHIADNAEFDD